MLSTTFALIFMVSTEALKTRNKEICKWSLRNTEKEFKDIWIDLLKILLESYCIVFL